MENELQHTSVTPRDFTFHLLERITDKFSKDHIIGYGGYGVVYKGVLDNGEEIAVKKLHYKYPELDDDEQFKNECTNLMRAQHQNIVRLVGYCYEITHKAMEYNGGYVLARVEERALCFEYLQGGSLDKHLSDESCGLGWRTRYKIIRGICQGLHYLHNGSKDPIYHLDLKPANILLDKNMTPKIGDFGLSRLFDSTQTYTTKAIRGTPGYMPPEYIDRYKITPKFDVFSLGVIIIQIMAGREGYSKCGDMPSEEFIDLVHANWLKTLQATMSSQTAHEVKTCIQIALRCVEADRVKRPTITEVVDELNKIDIAKRSLIDQKPVKMGYGTDGNVPTARHNVIDKETSQNALEVKSETNDSTDATTLKSGKPKIKGISLTELFTPEQISAHIDSLRLCVGQSKAKVKKNHLMASPENEDSCQLCNVEELTFEPRLIYCFPCGALIKRNEPHYTYCIGADTQFFCIPCYDESSGDTIEVERRNVLKARYEKKRNDEEAEEWWVQCDKCGCWQHQICALFNGRRNDGKESEYTCPYCYIKEVEHGLRMPLPQSAVLGASDLPRTVLSDHIEERLFKRLKLERQARASQTGHSFYEVAGAAGLVVRVVSSVDKKVEVKPLFLENFQQDNYPREFPYKSKAVLLFQKIEGVEVCLFKMYVQEFGAECAFPNQRRVYLSYLDSGKYFRPEIKSAYGEALRTFVYHEILIGYLEYCKQRGFTSCYMWACPPLEGDCILYHPEIQKTPKSDKLREWYLAMLGKATKEEIVVELTNLYDHFFITIRECKAKVTASRLPYFDGDYWPGAAEDVINQLRQGDDWKLQKKGKTENFVKKRALIAAGHTDLSGNASNDALLMQKLGETIYPVKEDFIMVHLQYSCRHCCIFILSGKRWVCHQCRSFYICDKCFSTEQQLEKWERHPSNSRDIHKLHPVDIVGVPEDTKDEDDILESEFFYSREAFLTLCEGNHYQYDTLRRAKYSSMMMLYHLHNPTSPAFVTRCNVCANNFETGQYWECEVCPDFDLCNGCYQKGAFNHPHKLTNHPSAADRDAQTKEARQMRVQQLREMLDLLVHTSTCRSGSCQFANCRKVKGLFWHGMQCKRRASGGCALCRKMWYMLQLHARACRDSGCSTPRCRDLKGHLRRLQQQSESRRRAAVNEMMRQ